MLGAFAWLSLFRNSNSVEVNHFHLNMEYEAGEVTLATHTSVGRLHMLEQIGNRWGGPISVAVFLHDLDDELVQLNNALNSLSPDIRSRVNYSVVFFSQNLWDYPVNLMRNRVIQSITTELMFLVDIDFIPSAGLYPWIVEHAATLYERSTTDKLAYVIPIFQQLEGTSIPRDKPALLDQWAKGSISPNYKAGDHVGHRATNYPKWKLMPSGLYTIDYESRFEPYFIIPTELMPLYDERFLYYGLDKILHALSMHLDGFKFVGVSEHFIVHKSHDAAAWGDKQQDTINALWRVFERLEAKKSNYYALKYWFRDTISCGIFGAYCP